MSFFILFGIASDRVAKELSTFVAIHYETCFYHSCAFKFKYLFDVYRQCNELRNLVSSWDLRFFKKLRTDINCINLTEHAWSIKGIDKHFSEFFYFVEIKKKLWYKKFKKLFKVMREHGQTKPTFGRGFVEQPI